MAVDPTSARPSDPVALRMQYLRTAIRTRLREAKDIGPPPQQAPEASARSVVDAFVQAFLRTRWCHDVEAALDSSTQLLRDNWDQLSEEQREEFEKEIVELLEDYGNICG